MNTPHAGDRVCVEPNPVRHGLASADAATAWSMRGSPADRRGPGPAELHRRLLALIGDYAALTSIATTRAAYGGTRAGERHEAYLAVIPRRGDSCA